MRLRGKTTPVLLCAGIATAAMMLADHPSAHACGCFAPPSPAVPVVQAGERILFAMEDGQVTAHVQIQYSGDAEEFAWLVPVPAVPEVGVGTDELFNQLIATTQPRYQITRIYSGNCPFDPSLRSAESAQSSNDSRDGADAGGSAPDPSPLIVQDVVGPYAFAVLDAGSKAPMLEWLNENGYFVPTGTEDVIDPYIRPNSYFLALKLRKGTSVGDLQPVVLTYPSELPMIPIELTGVAAEPDMGVMVWMLGESRAIPRNYFHTVVNDARIDWLNAGINYVEVVTAAVDDARNHHSFVTEYAGSSEVMQNVLNYDGRYGNLYELATINDAFGYLEFMSFSGFTLSNPQGRFFGNQFPSQVIAILGRYLPMPEGLAEQGISENEYYLNLRWYWTNFRDQFPDLFTGYDLDFDPVALTDELRERVIEPTLAAGDLFDAHIYLTRMFTTLSPEEMTRDPVFSFNPHLPDVSNVHTAELTYLRGSGTNKPRSEVPAVLVTEQGWTLYLPDGEANYDWENAALPASMATETLREEGDAQVVGDNSVAIRTAIDDYRPYRRGCSIGAGSDRNGAVIAMFIVLCAGLTVRRRSDRQPAQRTQ